MHYALLSLQMFKVRQKVSELRTNLGDRWEDKCFRLPVLQVDTSTINKKRKRRDLDSEEGFDSSFDDFFGETNDDNPWIKNDFE